MRPLSPHPLLRDCLLSLALLGCPPALADDTPLAPQLPAWQVLEFEQQAFLVTAHSRVELLPDDEDQGQWLLTADSSIASNSEHVVLTLTAKDGRALHRSRLSKGKEERYKSYDFLPGHILRERRDPPPKTGLPPCQWPVSSRKEIAYPGTGDSLVVTDAYALLLLADRFRGSPDKTAELVINTEFNFYRVRLGHSDTSPEIRVNYQDLDTQATVTGPRSTRGVTLRVSPLGEQPDKPDFSLLGLSGDITVLFDSETGLPLQLQGTAPRIGRTQISLKAFTPRAPAP